MSLVNRCTVSDLLSHDVLLLSYIGYVLGNTQARVASDSAATSLLLFTLKAQFSPCPRSNKYTTNDLNG
jgi:hypothetical protein